MQPRACAFDNPAINAQTAAMLGMTFGNFGMYASSTQFLTQALRIVSPVHVYFVRALPRSSRFSSDRWHLVDQGQRFTHVCLVGAGGGDGQGNALCVRENVVLGAQFAAIRRVFAAIFTSSQRPRMGAV